MATNARISMVDLGVQYSSIKKDIDEAIKRVLLSGHYSEGPEVSEFENHFAKFQKVDYCIGLSSGTAALHGILTALNISHGDEVIVPSNTCFATVEAIILTGATPVFIDCEEDFYNIDPVLIETIISNNTRAILTVHLYGQPSNVDKLKTISERNNIALIEDCCQAHLATYNKVPVGNFGIAGAFSFYPTKNLGAFGEAGAVVTNNAEFARKIRLLKNHGSGTKNIHEIIGYNYRMDSFQAAILLAKLKYLNRWTNTRRNNATLYNKLLSDLDDLILPVPNKNAKHVYHLYVIRTSKRDELQMHLHQCGIETAVHYPVPCHLQPALQYMEPSRVGLEKCEKFSMEILSLPIAEHLSEKDIIYISTCIRQFLAQQ